MSKQPTINASKIGFVGAGNMASAIIGGLVNNGFDSSSIFIFDPNTDNLNKLSKTFGIHACQSNEEVVLNTNAIVLAVKPQIMQTVLTPLQKSLAKQRSLIISIAAGIPCDHINTWLKDEHAIVRVMPNTPALVGAGACGLYASKQATETQKQLAEDLLNSIGISSWVDNEGDIDAVTALSGSGPAYFMLFTKALIDAGKQAGLSEAAATKLALQTCEGSAKLMRNSDDSIEQLIKNVTSPNGTTEQALLSFNQNKLEECVHKAFNAAFNRSKELANELK